MNLDLLAIAAHPDDVELTCGGTLLKMAQAGYSTGILDLTAGHNGSRGWMYAALWLGCWICLIALVRRDEPPRSP